MTRRDWQHRLDDWFTGHAIVCTLYCIARDWWHSLTNTEGHS